eukprot:scaffold292_cov106-Alexandrium_tamarense.AAC.2
MGAVEMMCLSSLRCARSDEWSRHAATTPLMSLMSRTVSVVCITASRSLSETSLLKPRNKQNYNDCDSYSFQTAKTGSNIIF